MHERNPYKIPPDFDSLAHAYPPLRPHITRTSDNGLPTVDFHDETAQRRLTQALLYRDFDIQLEIPSDRLCPPVPNRLNYVLWLLDIVSHTSSSEHLAQVHGIDIGTGASAIYPLIACRLSPNWHFVATDIDGVSLVSAQANIDRNGLSDHITLLRADPTGPIMVPLIQNTAASFDFSMCNPPFYASTEEATRTAAAKELLPSAVCTGADVEMITPGGEEAFVSKMVDESITHGQRCRWYTSMVGKQSSLTALVTLLRAHSITNYALTELVQGHTRRWALAWSFTDTRLPDDIARPSAPALRRLLPPRTTHLQPLRIAPPAGTIRHILSPLADEAVSISDAPGNKVCVVARQDTWSRSARRKARAALPDVDREKRMEGGAEEEEGTSQRQVLLVAHVWVEECMGDARESKGVQLVVQWKRGHDAQAFERFASHVGRKMREVTEAEVEA
ncbi:S-adenosyl-L-methionine dependent methyltransferase [Russula ochroleuca]|uniref:S-adenosyl-L-methionine dependent methyltransferase n=1 Tax=Russula ochroleuca TaxID=152965 RepID=A0A9P5TDC1_9AGAM|nr:S-adenosyl-L-methionine dependent methyltransferase [Russula ochroleuca]